MDKKSLSENVFIAHIKGSEKEIILLKSEDDNETFYYEMNNMANWEEEEFEIISLNPELNNKTFKYNDIDVKVVIDLYQNNWIYLGLKTLDDTPYCTFSVNLERMNSPFPIVDRAFIDTNNVPDIENFLTTNCIATFTGYKRTSGFHEYPLYSLNYTMLYQICPDAFILIINLYLKQVLNLIIE